jgi:hypothetical protein
MADDVIIVQPVIPTIKVTPVIPNIIVTSPGPQGPAGAFSVGSVSYTHIQNTPSATWTINHNLGFNPVPVILDSAGTQCEGTLTYITLNTMTLTFTSAFAGTAYII